VNTVVESRHGEYDKSMTKRKITVTVDERVVDTLTRLGGKNFSSTVNDALVVIAERLERHEALGLLLDELEVKFGPTSPEAEAMANAALDELDGIGPDVPNRP
jgi:hypothetical protein